MSDSLAHTEILSFRKKVLKDNNYKVFLFKEDTS